MLINNRSYLHIQKPSKLNSICFAGNEDESKASQGAQSQETAKDKGMFLNPEEMKANKTPQQKRRDFAWTMVTRFTNSKVDLGIMILALSSLFIPPLQLLSVPLFIGRSVLRYIQGRRTPVQNIDAYWDARRANESPNIYQFSKGKFPEKPDNNEIPDKNAK